MHEMMAQAVTVFMGFFAIMNPVANTPVFIGLTASDDERVRAMIARRSVLLAFLIVAVFCVTGKLLFELFGLTLPALHVAGGIIVFMIGLHMLQGEPSRVHNPSAEDNQASLEAKLNVAISPLAIPILAGPGTIATAMNYSAAGGYAETIITVAAFAILCVITYAFFIYGERFVEYIGDGAIKVITRLMGLILAVIGTQMFIEGVYGAIHAYN